MRRPVNRMPAVHPGQILREDFLVPLGMSANALATALGVPANLISLGAIDFGLIVDGAVVMMENSVRHLADGKRHSVIDTVRAAAHEVARPIVFAVAIIIAVYLPILTLEGLEGRMFRPMAVTVCSAIFGSLVIALTVVPAAAELIFRRPLKPHQDRKSVV
mgnify:CR=1 FL=1